MEKNLKKILEFPFKATWYAQIGAFTSTKYQERITEEKNINPRTYTYYSLGFSWFLRATVLGSYYVGNNEFGDSVNEYVANVLEKGIGTWGLIGLIEDVAKIGYMIKTKRPTSLLFIEFPIYRGGFKGVKKTKSAYESIKNFVKKRIHRKLVNNPEIKKNNITIDDLL